MNEKEKPQQEIKLHPPPKVTYNPWELSRFNHLKTSTRKAQLVLGLQTYVKNLERKSLNKAYISKCSLKEDVQPV